VTAPKGSIKERLSRYREINLSVKGRKSGKTISMPVWFAKGKTLEEIEHEFTSVGGTFSSEQRP
jgi:hypothetical protein